MAKVIVGTGNREKSIAEKLTQEIGEEVFLLSSSIDQAGLVRATRDFKADFVIFGPEVPLVRGDVNYFAEHAPSIKVFGPSRLAAELEGSKIYMKTRCHRWGIPTADFDFAGGYKIAETNIKKRGWRVVKADGLCSGKGVYVVDTEEQALAAVEKVLKADPRVLIEEKLDGWEISYFCITDGFSYRRLPAARDYKRLRAGSNIMTGGMGAYAPLSEANDEVIAQIERRIIKPLIAGMAREGRLYQGVLYAGIMMTKEGPKLLEVNCRFGDPECQVLMALLDALSQGVLDAG